MKKVALITLLFATLAVPLLANAQQPEFCRSHVYQSLPPDNGSGQAVPPLLIALPPTAAGTFYLETRLLGTGSDGAIELYQETNHVAGLQRGGKASMLEGDAENPACVDSVTPDQMLI